MPCRHSWKDAGFVLLPAIAEVGKGITWIKAKARYCEKCGEMSFQFKAFEVNGGNKLE